MTPKYKRMLEGMVKNASGDPGLWFVYILECADGTLYTGVTNDLKRRFETHNAGKGAKYTRTRLPVKIRYYEECAGRSAALIRECRVKALPRDKKVKLVRIPLLSETQ